MRAELDRRLAGKCLILTDSSTVVGLLTGSVSFVSDIQVLANGMNCVALAFLVPVKQATFGRI